MKKLFFLCALLACCTCPFSQKISRIDFDTIKNSLTASPDLYKDLMKRFKDSDSTLTPADYNTLYFGQCFQEDFNPYGSDAENFEKFKKQYEKQEYNKALPFVLKILDKNPMDIQMTFKALVCYHYLKDEENKAKMKRRYENILLSILESGDGRTAATAFVVMKVSDEYELMRNMEVENTMQSLVHGPEGSCDLMTLKPNDLGLEKLYFNVSKLFESMSKMFKEKN